MSFDMKIDPINALRILMLGAKGPEIHLFCYKHVNVLRLC